MKRKISFINIAAVTVSDCAKSFEFVLHVPTEYDYRYSCPRYRTLLSQVIGEPKSLIY